MTDRITIRRPDDWHVHLRDGDMLKAVAPYTARQFARAIVMPNLSPPVTSVASATAYRERIIAAAPGLTPLMTAYLTDSADPAELTHGHSEGVFTAAKLYPVTHHGAVARPPPVATQSRTTPRGGRAIRARQSSPGRMRPLRCSAYR